MRSPARILQRVSLCSSLAIATALVLGPTPAAAQSFEANNVAPVTTNGAIVTTSPGVTNIALQSGQTVIDWTPNDTAVGNFGGIGFQYGGTATFSSANNFAVLNRINPVDPTRLISMDGNIVSTVAGQTGGSVFFYSPAGIVLGPNALINVGSLVLTTSPIAVDGSGQFMNGTTVTFGNANPNSFIFTNPGSIINTLNNGSYVAMVAPRVGHDGTINVNGSAALVAAEAATISFNTDGLFNITVDVGTAESQNEGIEVNGTITGPASSGPGDYHRAYLVAVPKNTLLTMAIGSGADLGFEIAGAANVVGNAVVLSAGHDISFGSTSEAPSAAAGALANISVTNSNFTSALYGRASGNAVVGASGGGSAAFASDVSLRAANNVQFTSGNPGSTVTVGGNLTLSANADGLNEGDSAAAGNVQLMAFNGGSLSVTGTTSLSAIGTGGFSANPLVASGDGTGGTILVQSTTGGAMSLGIGLIADASGLGGSFFGEVDSGNGTGGTVNVFTSGNSSFSAGGDTTLVANGTAGQPSDCSPCGGTGGIGDGGTINVQAHTGAGNTMAFGALYMTANGMGGRGQTGDGGLGQGGDVTFFAIDQNSVTVATDVSVSVAGIGGRSFGVDSLGGAGLGGNVTIAGNNGSLDIGDSFSVYVFGEGGDSEFGAGGYGEGGFGQLYADNGSVAVGSYATIYASGSGGDGLASGGEGQGGFAYIISRTGGSLTIGSSVQLNADGEGGRAYDADGLGGDGGLGDGGHVEIYANNAALDIQDTLYLSARGEGGDAGGGQNAGDGLGGDIYLQAISGGSLSVAGGLYANAVGTGAYLSSGTTNSGDATGGFIGIYSRDGDSTLTVTGSANLDADGVANAQGECFPCGGIGGIGQGGNIIVSSQGPIGTNGNFMSFNNGLLATANGYGGDGVGGAAGEGFGGNVALSAIDGNRVSVVGNATLLAKGYGGYDFGGFAGGDGTGGLAQILTLGTGDTNLSIEGDAFVDASGYGGDSGRQNGGGEGPGGDGFGGTAEIGASSGTLSVINAYIDAGGWGGNTQTNTGGNGTGGDSTLFANGGDVTVLNIASLDASGRGGAGIVGGDGYGGGDFSDPQGVFGGAGGAQIFAMNGDIAIGSYANVSADGYGGDGTDFGGDGFLEAGADGGIGGNGFGGHAAIVSRNNDLGPSSITITGSETGAYVSADGFGGDGGGGAYGGNGLDGTDGASGNQGEDGTAGGPGGAGGMGGAGGTGTGGIATIVANAGNGQLTIDFASASAVGEGGSGGTGGDGGAGGNGGNGGFGIDLPGGNGGAGGDGGNAGSGGAGGAGIGGNATIGTASGNPQALDGNGGLATIGFATVNANASGGNGGNGGFAGSAGAGGIGGTGSPGGSDGLAGASGLDGNGGNGGDAQNGAAILLVRGSTLDVGFAELFANATGGGGGFGGGDFGTQGAGGNATVGGDNGAIAVIVTNRFTLPAQRGTLIAGSINGTADAIGGTGSFGGNSETLGGNMFLVRNSDATIDNLSFASAAWNVGVGALPDSIAVINGEVTVANDFTFITLGDMSLFADVGAFGGAMQVGGTLTLTAGNFVPDVDNEPPLNAGTYFANLIDITSNLNIYTTANLDSLLGLNLNAAGFVVTGNLNGNAGDVFIDAQGGLVDVGNVDGGFVNIQASDSVDAGDISSDTNIQVTAGADMTLGNLVAGVTIDPNSNKAVRLNADGSINVGNVTALGGIDFDATGSVTGLDLISGEAVFATADGAISFGDISSGLINPQPPTGDPFSVGLGSGVSINVGDVAAANGIGFVTFGALTTGDLNAGSDVLALAGGDMLLGAITAGPSGRTYLADVSMWVDAGGIVGSGDSNVDPEVIFAAAPVATGGSITTLDVTAGSDIDANAGTSASFGTVISSTGAVQLSAVASLSFLDIAAGTFVTIDPTAIVGGDVTALAGDVNMTGDSIAIGNVSASDNVFLTALAGDLSTGTIDAGIDVTLDATGDVTTGNITAGGLIDATGASLTLGNLSANSIALTTTVADLTVGNVTIPGDLVLTTAGDLVFGDLEAFDVDLAATGSITGGNIDSDTDISATAGTSIAFLDLEAGGFDDSEGFWDGSVDLAAGGDVATGGIVAEGAVTVDAGGLIATLDIDARDTVDLAAVESILTGHITAATIDLFAGADITTGDLTTLFLAQINGGLGLLLFPGASITLESGGDISTGDIDSRDGVYANAGGGIATGAIDAVDFVQLLAGGNISTADILAGDFIDIFTESGGIATGDLGAGAEIHLDAGGSISFGDASAGVHFDFESGGAVTGGNVVAGVNVGGGAEGAVTLGDITAGFGEGENDDTFSVGISSATSITVGDVLGAQRVGFATLGDLSTGSIESGWDFMALVGGDISTGAITTGEGDRVYMADASMFETGGGEDNFDPEIVLALDPVPTGGSITIGGPVSTGQFDAAAGADLNAGQITAQGIHGNAGGTARLSGIWSAGSVDLASNDIDILATGGISATGSVSLFSSNATQALIGDGLTGGGYALSNAEFGRIEGGSVFILARGDASAAQDMLIGDLTVTGPSAGSTIESSEGILVFGTGDIDGETPGGVIRVVGDVVATGFGSGNAIEFYADRFELDAATGGISITSSGGALSGELGLYAEQIHVAQGSILDQLAANPRYGGYQDDLNAPASVQRPDGVLNAATIWIESDNLQNILIQNTGSEETPAGFLAQAIFVNDDEEIAGSPGSIDVVVNGQLQTEGGTLTGIAVRDALVEGENLTPFTGNSTINGCELVGDCRSNDGPVIGLPTEFSLIIDPGLPELPFDGDETSSAIQAPPALFDTRPLDPDGTVDEPISGSGNPALIDSGPTGGDEQCVAAGTEDNRQCTPATNSGDQQ